MEVSTQRQWRAEPAAAPGRRFSHAGDRDAGLPSGSAGFFFYSSALKQVSFNGEISRGTSINYVPAAGMPPVLMDNDSVWFSATVKPMPQLTIDNRYILNRYRDRVTHGSAFNNHIMRSKWNYQFTKQLSLRTVRAVQRGALQPQLL